MPEPIFTPSTKATSGHDENISFAEMSKMVGPELSGQLRDITLAVYSKAADYALQKGHHYCRHQVRVRAHRPRHNPGGRGAYSGLFPLLAGGQVSSRAVRRSRLTSSTCGTIWKKFAGTSSRRRRLFPPKWRAGPARNMSRLTTSSRGASWMCNGIDRSAVSARMNGADWVIIAGGRWRPPCTGGLHGVFSGSISHGGPDRGIPAGGVAVSAPGAVGLGTYLKSPWVADSAGFLIIFFAVAVAAGMAGRTARWVMKDVRASVFSTGFWVGCWGCCGAA